ncbi:ROK family protein [Leptospira gomenensis]|uniref:ROK family protein n=1 Tax=Leptospira gomenensis TaxID=2484974 RepID=A0A5F1Y8P4_9LEPT|nr:ROK family protein [Leptospira gomenensis]TGK29520.1 ROK family protein [Leptospira gomenensis]TGK33918.1 ROK family protein [Leptospira gomenensis]TGK44818.1 ROK family protein [Leptospira gomenensis]TGK64437.1 ROK family protein [Leptospira gomenensis]
MNSYLGIDIGAGSIKASLVHPDGTVLANTSRPTGAATNSKNFLESLENIVSEMRVPSLAAIGIGSPGPIDSDRGLLLQSANLPLLKEVALVDHLRNKFPYPVYYNNDANVAALGEYRFGNGKNSSNLLILTLGTGLGGGWVYQGKLFNGYKGSGMEVGHVTYDPRGPICGCGQRGCAETYFSASGFLTRYSEKTGTELSSAEEFFRRAERGEQAAVSLLDEGIEALAQLCRGLIHTLNPDTLVFTGGLIRSWAMFGDGLKRRIQELIFPIFRTYTRILPGENVSGTLGAAALCMEYHE